MADVAAWEVTPDQTIPTQAAGLFLFMPLLLDLHIDEVIRQAGYPGTKMIPAPQAILALLAGKLLGKRRISHIDDLNFDAGAGLFAGLNVLPKATYATDYSYKTTRQMNEQFVDGLLRRLPDAQRPGGSDFYLDFHTIPYRGAQAELDKHWAPLRNRALPSVMTFVAQDAEHRQLCYATANLLRDEAPTMAVRFVDHWKSAHGHYPTRILLDSRATVYEGLSQMNQREIGFITIRRRGSEMLRQAAACPSANWKGCQVTQAGSRVRHVQYLDQEVYLPNYDGPVRQLVVKGLGHPNPTFILTNDLPKPLPARQVIMDYATRNRIEHHLGEKITFFHLDCLSSEVRLNVDFDLTLTVVAHLLYQQLTHRLKGFATTTPASIYRKFVNTPGGIEIGHGGIGVHFDKRSHNPILKEAGLDRPTPPIPWCHNLPLQLAFP